MSSVSSDLDLTDEALDALRRRSRALLLLDAAERAGVAPLDAIRFHAFAYLADVLSPVWDLPAFDKVVLKSAGGPFYRDLQREIDTLVVMGLVEVSNLRYIERPNGGARLDAKYALRFESEHLEKLLSSLGARERSNALDAKDFELHGFLVELATALARLPEDEIDRAASADVTYSDPRVAPDNLIEFSSMNSKVTSNLSVATAERFNSFLPKGVRLSPGEKIYLYAAYLGKRIHARG
jgi:hypothetical protein